VVYPSARLGFVALPAPQAARLAQLKKVTSRQNSALLQETMARWMESGGFERHLRRMRRTYQQRMHKMIEVLSREPSLEFSVPDGGMSLWVDFGVDSDLLAARAAEKGVSVRSGSHYRLQSGPSTCLRLGFASSSKEELEEGLGRLLEAARELPRLKKA
jgi:GntR family transcriptional regulator/MocR family aminotransferase